MAISDEKLKIVINNYFKSECDVNTSIREAFEKGFRIGVKKGLMQIGADRKTEPQANADQHIQHVESVEPTWTKEEHEAFYTFLWNVINPNEMQNYIGMFEPKDEQTEREGE